MLNFQERWRRPARGHVLCVDSKGKEVSFKQPEGPAGAKAQRKGRNRARQLGTAGTGPQHCGWKAVGRSDVEGPRHHAMVSEIAGAAEVFKTNVCHESVPA